MYIAIVVAVMHDCLHAVGVDTFCPGTVWVRCVLLFRRCGFTCRCAGHMGVCCCMQMLFKAHAHTYVYVDFHVAVYANVDVYVDVSGFFDAHVRASGQPAARTWALTPIAGLCLGRIGTTG